MPLKDSMIFVTFTLARPSAEEVKLLLELQPTDPGWHRGEALSLECHIGRAYPEPGSVKISVLGSSGDMLDGVSTRLLDSLLNAQSDAILERCDSSQLPCHAFLLWSRSVPSSRQPGSSHSPHISHFIQAFGYGNCWPLP